MKWVFATVFFSLLFIGTTSCETEEKVVEQKITASNIDSLLMAHPDSVSLLIWRGEYRFKEHLYDLAMQDAAKAYRLDKQNTKTKMLFSDVLINRAVRSPQDVANAQAIYKEVLKKEKNNLRALLGVAKTYTYQQDFEKSFDYINKVLRADRKYRDAYVLKGTNYLAMGRIDDAKSSYETAVSLDSKFYEGYFFLANIYEAEGNDLLSIQYFKNALEIRPSSSEIRYRLAVAQQRYADSKDSLEERLEELEAAQVQYRVLSKDTMDFYANRGYFHLGFIQQFLLEDIDSAVFYYNKALQEEPRHVESWHNLGICYDYAGKKTKALESFAKALNYNPGYTISKEYADSIRLLPSVDRRVPKSKE
ncbi:tetratricopeptide repeat protein [Crocinitomicaceae bacterium]|nr:tetratricopeptide repeat protein [Crocinitomicaceae bacterium]